MARAIFAILGKIRVLSSIAHIFCEKVEISWKLLEDQKKKKYLEKLKLFSFYFINFELEKSVSIID